MPRCLSKLNLKIVQRFTKHEQIEVTKFRRVNKRRGKNFGKLIVKVSDELA